jgi:ketol-acid reductoisomerase
MTKVYRAADAPHGALAGESVAVLGYGHLGRSAALNLRDSGAKVRIGNREDAYADQARADGFEVVPLATAAGGDVVYVLLPDEVIPNLFETAIAPALRPGSAIAFGSGYSLAFDLIQPPSTVDVLLVAPRMAGTTARTRYLEGQGFWACVGVEADRSGRAQQRMLGLADGLGVLRAGAVQMSAKMEATLDLFVEQSVGAVLGMAIMMAFEVARDAGVPGEALVLEMYMSGEMEAVFQSFREHRRTTARRPSSGGSCARSRWTAKPWQRASAKCSRTSGTAASRSASRTRPATATRCSSSPGL